MWGQGKFSLGTMVGDLGTRREWQPLKVGALQPCGMREWAGVSAADKLRDLGQVKGQVPGLYL